MVDDNVSKNWYCSRQSRSYPGNPGLQHRVTTQREITMTKHDAARRAFLVRAAVGAGAVAGAGLIPDANAQNSEQHKQANAPASAHQHPSGSEHGAFFNHDDAATIAAFTERLMPGSPDMPGASEAGGVNYIDLALSGAYADLQDFYR